MRRLIACLAALLALSPLAASAAPDQAPAGYTLGVAPQFDQRKLFATWKPVVDALSEATGEPFRFRSAGSVPEFEQAVAKGSYDFIYVNPYHLYRERLRQGYIPLVRDVTPLRGVVAVRNDSAIREAADLDGKSLAVPSLNAIGASMLIQAELERVHGVRVKVVNAKSHSSAYLYAINRLSDAAGGVEKTLAEQEPAIRNALRVVYRTSDFPSHPIAAHPRIPEALRERVRRILLKLSADPAGRAMLHEIPMSRAVPASFKDYEAFRALDLDAYWTEPGAAAKP
ncbi:MAG TPA: phosphate/phosphite/phosphonate ABC transporter substrate-binding protein [Rhodocyclaceae bacterium]|nr:phosphate/phosphite/phosphonate ABC transporter substrate-binding protein [Rhodocyclaceae bacterium]